MSKPFFSKQAVSLSAASKSSVSKRAIFLLLLTVGGIDTIAAAQNAIETAPPRTPTNLPPSVAEKAQPADRRLIKPGDRTCLRQTGSLIPPKKGDCLTVAGRSYSGDELRNTGAINNARALQMLDPSISLGH